MAAYPRFDGRNGRVQDPYAFETTEYDTTSLSSDWNPSSFAVIDAPINTIVPAAKQGTTNPTIPSNQLDLPSLRITREDVREQLRELGYNDADLPNTVIDEFMTDLRDMYRREIQSDGILANVEFDLASNIVNDDASRQSEYAESSKVVQPVSERFHDYRGSAMNGGDSHENGIGTDYRTNGGLVTAQMSPEMVVRSVSKRVSPTNSTLDELRSSNLYPNPIPPPPAPPSVPSPQPQQQQYQPPSQQQGITTPQRPSPRQSNAASPRNNDNDSKPDAVCPVSESRGRNAPPANDDDANRGIDSIMRKLDLMDLNSVKKRVEEQKRWRSLHSLEDVSYSGRDWRRDVEQSLTTLGEETILHDEPSNYESRPLSAFSRYTTRTRASAPLPTKPKKHDPVALYHKHKAQWTSDPFLARLDGLVVRPSTRPNFRSEFCSMNAYSVFHMVKDCVVL
ncbi:hypothetical protein SmJEL517_g05010 [Synchytrium microbalum]|uniref:Uncharacterized protein n=1 Tax=Synchytrium microbalum TaxID=1806994 RepID=A0A507BX92_9FUNG|nr:uncharacterized protein SmJEL517_g05010 [Synchytrium microbalum]TPX31711.1 hypothetical protein SmJEL517_g05010 [Synchytrium microbalum]